MIVLATVSRRRVCVAVTALTAIAGPLRAQDPVVEGDVGNKVDSLLRAETANGFHGNVLVAVHGQVVLLKGYGLANEATGTPYSPSTLVQIGSCVKDFTKVAILQLVEAGRLRLSDSLVRFVPDLAADKRGITVQQLLEHTAGLPLGVATDAVPLTEAELLARLNALTLASPPGARERYSNLGYSLLALIVQRITHQPFDAYVAEHIARPAGLRETGSYLPRFDRTRIAQGYRGTRDIGTILDQPHDADGHLWSLRGNGGYLSTLSDMRRFYAALGDSTLLRDPAHRRMVFDPDGMAVLAGSDLVSFFAFANFPGRDVRVLLATNHSTTRGNEVLRAIDAALGPPPGGNGRAVVVTEGGRRGPPPAEGADHLPDDDVGRLIGAYLDAYNSGDTAVMHRFFAEHAVSDPGTPPVTTRLERYAEMRGNLGRLTFRTIRRAPDGDGWTVTAESERGEPVTLTFLVESAAPHRMRGLRVEVG